MILNVDEIAARYRSSIREEIKTLQAKIKIIGFLIKDNQISQTYARYTEAGCSDVGISFELKFVTPENIESHIQTANNDESITGIFVYYPISRDKNDDRLKELVFPRKDIEGMTSYWAKKLYANQRFDDLEHKHKSLLPCTPLAILKLLAETDVYGEYGLPLQNQTICVFNRSLVVGRPLAYMLANDGAQVFSFDIEGGLSINSFLEETGSVDRKEALAASDVVITGVPNESFEKIKASELKDGVICLNFSSVANFTQDAEDFARMYIPRVGPMTVAMCLRNALRMYSRNNLT